MTASTQPKNRTLGSSDLSVLPIGLGCMSLSGAYGRSSDDEAIRVIHHAIDRGVTMLDSSDMYGWGHNETLIGKALAGSRRGKVVLATKFGQTQQPGGANGVDGSPAYVKAACDASLKRLGVDVIDLYYQHRVDPATPIEETVGAMAELVTAGKVRHLGLSEVTADELRAAVAVHPIAAVQSEWSIWSRDVERSVVPAAAELGVGFVPYSPLGRGFLTGTVRSTADLSSANDFRKNMPRFSDGALDANLAVVDVVTSVAEAAGATAAQVALAWLRHRAETHGIASVPIPGTRRAARVEENLGSVTVTLTTDQLTALDAAADVVSGNRFRDMSWVSAGRE